MLRAGLSLFLLAALACGRTARQSEPQTLAAAQEQHPMLSCVDAVLDESPLVERIVGARRDSLPRAGGWLRLRNPPGPRSTGIGFYVRTERGTPREFVVNYIWPAPRVLLSAQSGALPDPRVADMEGEMLTDIGMRLLEDVRAQCAPNAPGAPACSRVNQGRGGVCVLGTA